MSHNIETIPGATSSFVSARENAWHRLGTVVPDTFDALQGMQTAHLAGWNVRKLPLIAHELTLNGITTINALERYMTVRTNPVTQATEYLGDVGSRYTVVQNEEHAEFLDLLVDESGAHFETMGSLGHGNRVFMSMRMPSHINVGGDVTDLYLIAQNSHDGSTQFEVCISPIRPVCQNTVTAAFKGAPHKYQVRHTASIRGRVQDAREVLDMTFAYSDRYAAQGEELLSQSFTDADFDAFLLSLYNVKGGDVANASTRTQNVMQGVRDLWKGSDTLQSTAGTRFGAFQAVTEYQTHFAMAQGKTPAEVATNRAVRDTGVEGDKFRTKALALLSA